MVLMVRSIGPKGFSEHETSDGVAVAICAVRIKFPSFVSFRYANLGEITIASDLHKVRSMDEVRALDGTLREEPSPVA